MKKKYSKENGIQLLRLARKTLTEKTGEIYKSDPPDTTDEIFKSHEATFVTLEKKNQLRGCIGSFFATNSICDNVIENTINAAFNDYRFPPVSVTELDDIDIEISILTKPEPLLFNSPGELINKLRPGIDGVILSKNHCKATFLPQVWSQMETKEEFLSYLCRKAGLAPLEWKEQGIEIQTYQVQKFCEKK